MQCEKQNNRNMGPPRKPLVMKEKFLKRNTGQRETLEKGVEKEPSRQKAQQGWAR
jgi:hypothetical protein